MASAQPRGTNNKPDLLKSLKRARKVLVQASSKKDSDSSENSAMMPADYSSLLVQAQISKYICDIAERNYRHHSEEAQKWSVSIGMSEETREMMGRLSDTGSREDAIEAQENQNKVAKWWLEEFKTAFKKLKKLSAKAGGEHEESASEKSSSEEESDGEDA